MSCEGVAQIYVAANQVLLEIEEDPNVHDRAQAIGTAKTNLANAKSAFDACVAKEPKSISSSVGLVGVWNFDGQPGPVIHVNFNTLTIDMSKFGRPTATGYIIGPSEIWVSFPDAGMFIGTRSENPPGQPRTITWTNGTVWSQDKLVLKQSS
jgi:hypothetical protein